MVENGRSSPWSIGTRQSSVSAGNALARSFVYNSYKPNTLSPIDSSLLRIHSSDSVHEDSADLANIDVPEEQPYQPYQSYQPIQNNEPYQQNVMNNTNNNSYSDENSQLINDSSFDEFSSNYTFENSFKKRRESNPIFDSIDFLRNSSKDQIWKQCFLKPIEYLPAVFLGTLLNVLDALSYGMIMFPIGEKLFSHMGSIGLSMFYVSTVIAQLVYSLGGSAFKSGIGSEMIEITPFFHKMALSILLSVESKYGTGNEGIIITTTIFTFAISSIITGIVFIILGKCKLGKLVGFFPRHILIGCIGGVGYFLIITGIEVSSRIQGGIEYNYQTFKYLFDDYQILLQWTIPLLLSILLIIIQKLNSNPLIVPIYFIMIFIIFHLLIWIIPGWTLEIARGNGWIFTMTETSNDSWYSFYEYYDFQKCDWMLIIEQIPTILALTFFGILHVPINVPALALSIGMDTFDVDRELIAHGFSNLISGMVGSIQNYLVYSNSVLFIKSGADSRISGVMLAIATFFVMLIGNKIIKFIPICVVGSLIYLLGYELLKESIFDTFGRIRRFEYITILIIVITMGIWDFVYGILIGILITFISFIIEAGSKPVITKTVTGEYARSIVIRNSRQNEFLKNVGKQIFILKLTGTLFFGSIGGLESKIREMFEIANYKKQPIKYLIIDLNNIITFDFSAIEGFKRIRNLLKEKNCYFIITSNNSEGFVEMFKYCGLWETEKDQEMIVMFNNLNSALEWCENSFLKNYKIISKGITIGNNNNINNDNNKIIYNSPYTFSKNELLSGTPRQVQFLNAARNYKIKEQKEEEIIGNNSIDYKGEPTHLILQVMRGISTKTDGNFWSRLSKYLERVEYEDNQIIYEKIVNQPKLFFIESGIIGFEIKFNNLEFTIQSSELPLTLFGDLIKTYSDRSIKYQSNGKSVIWVLNSDKMKMLRNEEKEVYVELLEVYVRINTQRFESITSNILVS